MATFLLFLLFTFQTGERQTVTDYYYKIPRNYLAELPDLEARKRAIRVRDDKNGYLRLEGDWEGYAEVVLFRRPEGGWLLGIAVAHCGPACEQRVYFLEPQSWRDCSAEVFPITRSQVAERFQKLGIRLTEDYGEALPYLVILPRYGTTVRIIVQPEFTERETTIMKLVYTGGRFVEKR